MESAVGKTSTGRESASFVTSYAQSLHAHSKVVSKTLQLLRGTRVAPSTSEIG